MVSIRGAMSGGTEGQYIHLHVVIPKSLLAGNRRGSNVRYKAPKSGRRRKGAADFQTD